MGRVSASGASLRIPTSAKDESATLRKHPYAEELIASGIDDLAKYRIMRLLYEHPSLVADAAHFATRLGYHSAESTAALLDELAASRLIIKDCDPAIRLQCYQLAHQDDAHTRLIRLYGTPRSSPELEGALQILAYRSLLRAGKSGHQKRLTA